MRFLPDTNKKQQSSRCHFMKKRISRDDKPNNGKHSLCLCGRCLPLPWYKIFYAKSYSSKTLIKAGSINCL